MKNNKLIVCAIRDNKIGAYQRPIFVEHKIQAFRMFHQLIKAGDTPVAAFPEDFDMVTLGSFDQGDGSFEQKMEIIIEGKNLRVKE